MPAPLDVLIIEDDAAIRSTTMAALEDEGYLVLGAESGAEGLRLLREADSRPTLILLDLMMADMDGWQFRREQLRDPALAEIPVVVFTAHTVGAGGEPAPPVAAVIKKPFRLDLLLDTVARHCPRH